VPSRTLVAGCPLWHPLAGGNRARSGDMDLSANEAPSSPGAAAIHTLLSRLRSSVDGILSGGPDDGQANLTLAQLKSAMRALLLAADAMRDGLSSEGDRADDHRLTLSNALYQRAQLQRAVAECRAFPTPQLDTIALVDEALVGGGSTAAAQADGVEEVEAAAHARFKARLAHEAAGRRALLARVEAAREQLAVLRAGNAALQASLSAVPAALTAAMGGLTAVLPGASDATATPQALPAPLRALAAHIAGSVTAGVLDSRRGTASTTASAAAAGHVSCQVVTTAPQAGTSHAAAAAGSHVRVQAATLSTYAPVLGVPIPALAHGAVAGRHAPDAPSSSATAPTVGTKRRRNSVDAADASAAVTMDAAGTGTVVVPLLTAVAAHPVQLRIAVDPSRGVGTAHVFVVTFQPLLGASGRLIVTAESATIQPVLQDAAGGGVGAAVEGVVADDEGGGGVEARDGGESGASVSNETPAARVATRARLEDGAAALSAASNASIVGLAPPWLQAVAAAGSLAEQRAACAEVVRRLWEVAQAALAAGGA